MIIENVNVATPKNNNYAAGDDFENLEILKNVDISIQGDKIDKISPSGIKEEGRWVIPTFVDPHTHLVFCGTREEEIDLRKKIGYEGVLNEGGGIYRTINSTSECDEYQLFEESRDRMISMMRNGTSSFEIKTGYGLSLENEEKTLLVIERLEKDLGVTVKKTLLAHVPPKGIDESKFLKTFQEMIEQFSKKIDYVDVFVDKGAFSPSFAREALVYSNALNISGRLHLNEIENLSGLSSLKDLNIVSYDHMRETKEVELDLLKGKIVTVLPFTSMLLGKSTAIFEKMKQVGVILALGSDISPNSYITSVPLIISLARQTLPFTLENLINMSTLNSAHSLSLSNTEGSIHPGKMANFIILKRGFRRFGYDVGDDPIKEVYIKGRAVS